MTVVFDGDTFADAGGRRTLGPILEPLELLRLAGIRERIGEEETGVVDATALSVNGFL